VSGAVDVDAAVDLDAVDDLTNVDSRLRAFWHPVCHIHDVGTEPIRVELLGEPYAVVAIDGRVVAFPDRCPHRWARLSDGRVIDDTLECPYHGWRFDGTGRCTLVPALGAGSPVPPRADVAAPAVRLAHGLVFMAPEPARVELLPIPEWDEPGITAAWLPDVTAAIGAAPFIDNFLDVAHFPFVHAGTFGAGEDRLVHDHDVEHLPGTGGLQLRYEHLVHNHEDPGVTTGARPLLQPRVMEYTYAPPFAARLRIELPMTGVDNTVVTWARPRDARTTVLSTVLLRNDLGDDHDGSRARAAVDYELAVLHEDLRILEHLPDAPFPLTLPAQVHTRADRTTVELRRLLRAVLNGTHATASAQGPSPAPGGLTDPADRVGPARSAASGSTLL